MMGRDLNGSWLDFQGSASNLSLLTSSALEDDEHDVTFAPPNSPIAPSNVVIRGTINIPTLDQTLNADDPEGASPIVRGVLDSTWFPYTNCENGPMTPDNNYPTCGSVYPYFSYRHDLTFRDLQLANSLPNGSNNFLNESNFEMLHTSLLDSNRKSKKKVFTDQGNDNTFEERKQIDYESNIFSNNNNNNANCPALEPMFQIFREIKPRDSHLSHIVSNIKRLLSNKIVSSSDVCAEDFVKKSAELFQTSSQFDDEIAIFHLVSLFEQVLSDSELSMDRIHLISQYCRSPLGKLALAGNPEISKRAENCLELLK